MLCSVGNDGKVVEGINNVPTGREGRPVLLVGNHQLLGLDMGLIIKKFLDDKQVSTYQGTSNSTYIYVHITLSIHS
jgi:hypothetical protein